MASEAATLARTRAVRLMEHADRLDRLHPVRRRRRLSAREDVLDPLSAARVRLPGAGLDPAVAGLRVLQSVPRQLALRRPAGESLAANSSATRWAFATIWPAIFEGADLVDVWRGSSARAAARQDRHLARPEPARIGDWFDGRGRLGLLMLAWPLVYPSPYLAAPVWLGFILVLDPINWRLGEQSLLGDLHDPRVRSTRIVNLALSGFLCGFVWEFLNYWSRAKWHYTVPIMENVKIFEMPLPGYFGFPAFALECFTMYVFVRALCRRVPGFSALILEHVSETVVPERTLRTLRRVVISRS